MRWWSLLPFIVLLNGRTISADDVPRVYHLEVANVGDVRSRQYELRLDGTTYRDRSSFVDAVAHLAPGSRIVWRFGCVGFDVIPLGPEPQMTFNEFSQLCRARKIRFISSIGYRETLLRKNLAAPQKGFASTAAARAWLESCGVQFGPGSGLHWSPLSKQLAVRLPQEQLDLVEVILASPAPEAR